MRKVIASLLSLFALGAVAQTQLTSTDLTNAYKTRTYTGRVSCHDPSIVVDNISNPSQPTYYIYGSHLGRGKTTTTDNYQKWTSFKAGQESTDATNSLFADVNGKLVNYSEAYNTHAVKEVKNYKGETVQFGNFNAHAWQFAGSAVEGNQWAPDVIYNKTMKKWCMYMSLNGDHWGSVIVCFTSDNIEGPWIYQGPVVFSGFQGVYAHNGFAATDDWKQTDLAIATGVTSLPSRYKTSAWGTYWPNCIDPCVFYDDDDNLWMSYGSWSGGIFMIRLDKENGLRDYTYQFPYEVNGKAATPGTANANTTSDPYFGKKIAGGYYVSGEASYIEKIGKYYFLFLSYGGLESNGGYQMRIFRSENPDGPFVDCYGTSAIYNRYALNYSATATDNRGVLLFGGYQWDTMTGAELAQGHNSAFTDLQGRSFVVYHTRFSNGGEGHQVRVHQLFLNDEGWLMAAPFEFDGETITNEEIASKASIDDSEIAGDYQFMRHQYNQNTADKAFETPVNITLNEDGTISGSQTGTWERTAGTDFIHLTIGGVVYRGALVRQTIDYTNISALSIVALSSSSGSLTIGQNSFTRQQEVWAVKADTKAAIKYAVDKIGVTIPPTVKSSLTLPVVGKLGTHLSWKSSNPAVMTDDGTIRGSGNINLTLTVSKDGYEYSQKKYYCYVNASDAAIVPIYYPESSIKNTTNTFWTSFSDYYDLQAGKKMEFKFYNYSGKGESWYNWSLVASTAVRNTSNYSEYFVLRNDSYGWFTALGGNTLDNSANVTFTKEDNFDMSTFQEDMDGSWVDMIVGLDASGKLTMTSTITTAKKKVYNYSFSMVMASKPSQVKLFFTGEHSYIDGSSILTGISAPVANKQVTDGKWYNLAGQQVDKSYKGMVIVNGKKFMNK